MINKTGQAAKNILNGHSNIIMVIKGHTGILFVYNSDVCYFCVFLKFTDFPLKYMSTAVIITTLLSIVIAGWISTKNVKSKGWLNGAIVGFIYMLILYLVSSIVYREFAINSYVLILLGIGILSGSIGGILGINLKR